MKEIVLTGFGPFGDVNDNPSSLNLKDIELPENVSVVTDIRVSISGVEDFLKSDTWKRNALFIHFGVNATAESIQIERFGYNEMTFRIPDVDGLTVDHKPIDSNPVGHRLETNVNVYKLASKLGVEISQDPGRYICNYLYYRSLVETGGSSLFIHVPSYTTISKEDQKTFIRNSVHHLLLNNRILE